MEGPNTTQPLASIQRPVSKALLLIVFDVPDPGVEVFGWGRGGGPRPLLADPSLSPLFSQLGGLRPHQIIIVGGFTPLLF